VSDARFSNLFARDAWASLPEAVRRRFSVQMAPGEAKHYAGEIIETRLSFAGRCLAHLARLVGAPLPLAEATSGHALTTVQEAPACGGQIWTRMYARGRRMPQVIQTVKRFSGPTGLEEYLGYGLLMRLTSRVEDRALVFRSAGYAVEIAGRALRVPPWLAPGDCTITHRDLGGGEFRFELVLEHPVLGVLIRQSARFRD